MSEEVKAFVEIACDESFAAPKRQIPDTLLNPAPSKKTATIADLVSKLKDLGAVHNFPRVALVNILTTLKDMTDLNLPFKVNGTTGKLVPVIDDYVETDVRNNTIDACINECMLYIGEHRTDIHCTRCFLPRYTKCHFGKCSDENCSPFINTSHTYRSANQVVIYRSLLIRLVEMCKKAVSGNPMFDYNATRRKVDGEMSDVLDGAAAVSHLFDMHSQFEKMKEAYHNLDNRRVVEFSVLLSFFYDGDALYKRSNDSAWPFLASVLNLNPSLRSKLGVGLFLVALHNLKVGSGAEQSMIDDLITEELKQGDKFVNVLRVTELLSKALFTNAS